MKSKTPSQFDHDMMTLALELAGKGIGQVEPNPAVGAVLVQNQKIIGQGYHHVYGAAHAEVDAIQNARACGHSLKGATIYVTLEPCCHWGKTPPCTDAIIDAGIKRVVTAVRDPSKKVAGKGIAKLKKHGVEVNVGLLADQAKELNAWFFKYHQTGLPWVICKWAQTLDGKLAARTGHSQWITCDASRQEAHRLRKTCQAIVVGVQTVLTDDPKLTVRLDSNPSSATVPNRVVLDSKLRIPLTSYLVQTAREVPTWVFTTPKARKKQIERLESAGVHVLTVPTDKMGMTDFSKTLSLMGKQGWTRIFVEGGAFLLSRFLSLKLTDELVVFQSSSLAIDDKAIQFRGLKPLQASDFLRFYQFRDARRLGEDVILKLWRK